MSIFVTLRKVALVLACLAPGAQARRVQNLIERLARSDSLEHKQLSESAMRRHDDHVLNPLESLAAFLSMLGKSTAFNPSKLEGVMLQGKKPTLQMRLQSRLAGSVSMQISRVGKAIKSGGKITWPNKQDRMRLLAEGMAPQDSGIVAPGGEPKDDDSAEFVIDCVKAADERKASDIVAFRVSHLTNAQDWMVNMIVNSRAQMGAVVSNIEDIVWENYELRPFRTGKKDNGWVLLDFGNVIVNVFTEDTRTHYNLEGLYEDAEYLDLSNIVLPNIGQDDPLADKDLLNDDDDDWQIDEDEWKLDDDDWELGENE